MKQNKKLLVREVKNTEENWYWKIGFFISEEISLKSKRKAKKGLQRLLNS